MDLRKVLSRLIVLAGCCLWVSGAYAQGVAMVLDRSGEVDVTQGAKTSRLNVLDYVAPDAELRLAAGASATLVYLATSQEWQFAGAGRYKLQAAQPAVLQGSPPKARGVPATTAQAVAKMEPSQRERMTLGAMVMRSLGPLRLQGPNGVDVLSARPTLLWQASDNDAVRITVVDASRNVVAQTTTAAQNWTIPVDLAGGEYEWRIELVSNAGGAVGPGRFRVLAGNDPRRSRIGAPPQEFSQRVAYAMLLESEDLPHDARLIWRALAAERPDEASLKPWAR